MTNLIIGDQKEIAEKTKIPYSTVNNILKGRCYGQHGDVVTNAAEEIIKLRFEKIEKEKLLYGKKNKEAVVDRF